MRLIEALKKIKDLERKHDDIVKKIALNSAISSIETPTYDGQTKHVTEWLQSCEDIVAEILRLRIAVQTTNLATKVTVELGGKRIKKSIAEWIHRRRDLAMQSCEAWEALTDRKIKEGAATGPGGQDMMIKIVRFYDPVKRDKMRELYRSEPDAVDAALEVANATTTLIE